MGLDLEALLSRVRRDVTAVHTAEGMKWTKQSMTPRRLAAHLNGGPARGVAFVAPGSDRASVGLLDLDSHKGETPWPSMVQALVKVVAALRARALEPSVWRSRGGRGIHVYVLWARPQQAAAVRAVLREAIQEAGFRSGTKGVGAGQIEVFPKQDSVPVDGFGSQVILPGAGQSAPLCEAAGWEPGPQSPWPLNEIDLAPIAARPVQTDWAGAGVEADELLELLRSSALSNDSYDDWVKAGMICHAESAGASWGLAVWDAWSATSSKYDEPALVAKWGSFGRRDGPLVTARSLGEPPAKPGAFDTAPGPEPLRLVRDKLGRAEATLPNLAAVLARPDITGWRIQHDAFLASEVVIEGGRRRSLTDADMVRFREQLERGGGALGPGFKPIKRELWRDAVLKAAAGDSCDSAIDWLTSLEATFGWDGVPRINTFMARYFGCEPNAYSAAVGRYLWSALAGRVLQPGTKADMALILVGKQGAGKSTAVERLAPTPDWYTDFSLGELKDADLARRMRGIVVGELGELAGMRSREREWLKGWMTRRYERWTPKYQERDVTMARRCVFVGTTNETALLSDPTGERRWLPIEVGDIDIDGLERDRAQLWLEGAALFRTVGVVWQPAESLAVEHHDRFRDRDAWEDTAVDWIQTGVLDGGIPGKVGFGLTDLWICAFGGQANTLTRAVEMRLGNLLKSAGCKKLRVRNGNERRWRWFLD